MDTRQESSSARHGTSRVADVEAFDGETEPVLRPEELDAVSVSKLRLRIQPYVQLLELHHPVDDLVLQARKDDEGTDFASNAVSEQRRLTKVQAVATLKPQKIFLVVHRIDFSVYFRRVERAEYSILKALRAGTSITGAIELAFKASSIPEMERAGYVRHCFETWAALGWFCQPAKAVANHEIKEKRKGVNYCHESTGYES
jgi:hypothetical protein